MKYIARFVMWLGGWKYKGELPVEKKAVIISVPHTSNWDFVWGELAFYFDEKRIFLFSVGYSSSCFAGYSGGPGKKR